jgi:hypothetical protein
MQFKSFMEALKGKQHKIDKNKNGQIDAHDFKLLQKEEAELFEAGPHDAAWVEKSARHERLYAYHTRMGNTAEAAKHKAENDKLYKKEETELDESEERMARADYKVGASGRKSHKEIVFNDAESKEDENKDSVKEEKFDPLKHVKNPTPGEKKAAKDVKRSSYADRAAMLRSAEADGRLKEAKMSDADMAERERIVKGMKKNIAGFKSRYGKDAKSVMYATATKQAMKEETVEEAVQKVDVPAYLRKQQGQTPLKLSDLKRKDTISDRENLAKLREEQLDEALDPSEIAGNPKMYDASTVKKAYYHKSVSPSDKESLARHLDRHHGNKEWRKPVKEELDEAMINGREYASHGLMHPDHAAHAVHKVTGNTVDFYAHGSGDKVSGKVTKNDGKAVHIKDTSGKTHQFKVQRGLPQQQNEEKKDDVPFDGPYTKTKPAKNSDGTAQSPMSRARELAKQGIAASRMDQQAKRKIKEAKDEQEYGYEGDMAMNQLSTLIRCAEMIKDTLKPDTDLPEWVQSKITLASDYIVTAADYLHSELEEQAPVAPVPDKKYIKGTPEHKAYKATKKPINGMPTNKMKESFDVDGNIINSKVSYKDFAMMLEYETKDGRYVHKGTYGGNYVDPEGADDADDKKPKQQPAEKRGRGRPAGAKSGARKITGTSKLFK